MARLPPSRHPLHCGLRIPDLRARDDSPLNRSCHQGVPAICLMRRLPAQSIRRCGLNATFRTRLQQCDGDWWPLSPRCYRVAHAARLGTDTEICDTVRLELLYREKPGEYLKLTASVLPKEFVFENAVTELDDEELDRMIEMLRERALSARQEQTLELKPVPKALLNGRH